MAEYYVPPPNEILAELAKVNRFRLADLEQNRAGRISPRQVVRLARWAWKPLWLSGSAFFGWMLLVILVPLVAPKFLGKMLLKKALFPAITITFGAATAFVITLLRTSRRTLMLAVDLWFGQADRLDGRATATQEEEELEGIGRLRGETATHYFYCIRMENFEVTGAAYTLLLEKYDRYRPYLRVYFAPRSKLLLSVEPVEEGSVGQIRSLASAVGHLPEDRKPEEQKWVFRPMTDSPVVGKVRPRTKALGPRS